jgi:hypothetical protein
MVRKFSNEKILPLADSTDKKNAFPNHLWREMGDLGLLGNNKFVNIYLNIILFLGISVPGK